jgi:hypothetical protein
MVVEKQIGLVSFVSFVVAVAISQTIQPLLRPVHTVMVRVSLALSVCSVRVAMDEASSVRFLTSGLPMNRRVVIAPRCGPISTSRCPTPTLIDRTTRRITIGSCRKFWPNLFLAL